MPQALRTLVMFWIFHIVILFSHASLTGAEEISDLLMSGNRALVHGNYHDAETLLGKALKIDPGNYKIIRLLADIKIKLEKYEEAERLLDRLLEMPVATGRDILVYIEGDPEPQEAELVDESVMAVDESAQDEDANQFSKFLKSVPKEPVPHYRVNFKKSGKMKLLPKSKTRIKYYGIPTATREQIMDLKTQILKKIIAAQQEKPVEEMVSIKGGCFQMGSNSGGPDEQPVHEVCISPFKMDKYEVRQKNFQAVTGLNPSQHVASELPVDSVTWEEARDYCKTLGLRLPTEAEWEYSARAETQTEFYWGNTVTGKEGNFCDSTCELNIREPGATDGFKHSAPAGSFPANPFGLFDMAGNVNEWVQDWRDVEKRYYLISPKTDPPGPRSELNACSGVSCVGAFSITSKMYRGGSWNQKAAEMRSANRRDSHFQLRAEGNGFRCASD